MSKIVKQQEEVTISFNQLKQYTNNANMLSSFTTAFSKRKIKFSSPFLFSILANGFSFRCPIRLFPTEKVNEHQQFSLEEYQNAVYENNHWIDIDEIMVNIILGESMSLEKRLPLLKKAKNHIIEFGESIESRSWNAQTPELVTIKRYKDICGQRIKTLTTRIDKHLTPIKEN